MSDRKPASPDHLPWLGGLAKLCQFVLRPRSRRAAVPADQLDDWIRRDTGADVVMPRDLQAGFYRKIMQRGQPLP
ncbi:hypothetical protein [Hoeflea ulvae]|uniref:Uncharacterized protein n=1 Tax=Hoeflea ulvae TaxID=2983764 RepID=A0ABT3YAC5_9HYPH|nr:hypothetical protein [Hoeflea ulvae]MCY0092672.1 hypothetical protein [Hoeflea ulvae]